MKYQTYLEQINGVEIYPIISLVIFFTFFVATTLWIFSKSKEEIEYEERLPLEDQ
jgi:cytochrome c oxidase cbb3-type subunit 4